MHPNEFMPYLKSKKEILDGYEGLVDLWWNDPMAHSIMHQIMAVGKYLTTPISISDQQDLDRLHSIFIDLGWPSVSAETELGQPIIVYEDQDGELWVTDGSDDRPVAAEKRMPFKVLSPEAIRRFHGVRGE